MSRQDERNPDPDPDPTSKPKAPIATILSHSFLNHSLDFATEWQVGIGGGIWTTGFLLCRYIEHHIAYFGPLFAGKRIIELGSGTGLVGLCLASSKNPSLLAPKEVVITDRADHLPLIRRNAETNGLASGSSSTTTATKVTVLEYDWLNDDVTHLEPLPFDIIVGTDVAYCEELYAPVVVALSRIASPKTLILLGVTRTDTRPEFFQLLHKAGFDYCLLPTDDCVNSKGVETNGGIASGFALMSVVRRE